MINSFNFFSNFNTVIGNGTFRKIDKIITFKYFLFDNRMVGVYFLNGELITDWQITDSEANRVTVYVKHTDRHQRNLLKLPDTEQTVLFTIEDGIITKVNPALKD